MIQVALLLKVLQVVVLPVSVGVLLKQGAPRIARRMEPVMPPLAVIAIVLIVSSIVGSQRDVLVDQGAALVVACVLLHAGGFFFGWLIPRCLGEPDTTCRTISLEVGMQNSGLGASLASAPSFAGQFANPMQAALAPVPSVAGVQPG